MFINVDTANEKAVNILQNAHVYLTGIATAKDVIPFLAQDKALLHSGPPIAWDHMCSAMKAAVCGAAVYEGWANDLKAAELLAESGKIAFASANDHGAVGSAAGIISPSMPIWKIKNETYGNMAYTAFHEGTGKILGFGGNDDEVIKNLKWMEQVLGPMLAEALRMHGTLDLTKMLAKGIQHGDEGHRCNMVCTSMLIRELTPYLLKTAANRDDVLAVLEFLNKDDQAFLNLSMGLCKATMDPAYGVDGSTVVTCICTNGYEFGMHIAGLGDQWITAPAVYAEGNYREGYSREDANPTMGDAYIVEANGIGGVAIGAAPEITHMIGRNGDESMHMTMDMYKITVAEHELFKIPALNFRGTPLGIDIRKVLKLELLPIITTGIAHKKPGIGQIGTGLIYPPLEIFENALAAFEE